MWPWHEFQILIPFMHNRFLSFISLHLSNFLFNTFSFKKSSLTKNLCYSFSSFLLPLAKRIEGLTAWVLLCLPSPSSKRIQRTHRLRILLILPFPLNKRFQRTNRLRYLLFPLTKIQKTNRLRILLFLPFFDWEFSFFLLFFVFFWGRGLPFSGLW